MLKLLLFLLLTGSAGIARATPLTASLDLCNVGLCSIDGIDPGTFMAEVVGTDVTGGIDFTVTTRNPGWLLWGGGVFAFNAPVGGMLVLPPGYSNAGSGNEAGFGVFEYRINGPTTGGLAANGATVFSFSVTGLDTSQVVANAKGHRFAAHIGVPEGTCDGRPCEGVTGFAADSATHAPEPGTLTLLGSALIGLGWIARRRRRG